MKEKHERAIKLLEAIKYFSHKIKVTEETKSETLHYFPNLTKKFDNDIDTYMRCINRLSIRYSNLIKSLE